MKTTEEILKKLQQRFIDNNKNIDYWAKLRDEELNLNHKKKADEYETIVQQYVTRNNEVANLYAFIKNIDWTNAYKELRGYTK